MAFRVGVELHSIEKARPSDGTAVIPHWGTQVPTLPRQVRRGRHPPACLMSSH